MNGNKMIRANSGAAPFGRGIRGGFGQPAAPAMPTAASRGNANDIGFGRMDPATTCGPFTGGAGIKGCGISNVPCGYQVLGAVLRDVPDATTAAGATYELEILAGRGFAFQPKFVYMFGIGAEPATSDFNCRFEIRNIQVMEGPQLIQAFGGAGPSAGLAPTTGAFSVLSDAYNNWDQAVPVSWDTFGAVSGQGIKFFFAPLADVAQDIHVIMWGDAADPSLVGQCLVSQACS